MTPFPPLDLAPGHDRGLSGRDLVRSGCQQNVAGWLAHLARHSGNGRVQTDGGVTLVLNGTARPGHPGVQHQAALRTDRKVGPNQVLEAADRFFGDQEYFITASRADRDLIRAAQRQGLEHNKAFDSIVMALEDRSRAVAKATLEAGPPTGVVVREVGTTDQRSIRAFAAVAADAFSRRPTAPMDADTVAALFAEPTVFGPPAKAWVAWHNDRPIGTALAYIDHNGVAGINWIGTLQEHRRNGLGKYLTALAIEDSFEHGATLATLQAAPMGINIYRQLGFQDVDTYHRFLRRAGTDSEHAAIGRTAA